MSYNKEDQVWSALLIIEVTIILSLILSLSGDHDRVYSITMPLIINATVHIAINSPANNCCCPLKLTKK